MEPLGTGSCDRRCKHHLSGPGNSGQAVDALAQMKRRQIKPVEREMTTDTSEADIRNLFDNYASGLDAFDAEAISHLFAYPAVIWQLDRGNMFEDDDELIETVEALLGDCDRLGVVRSDYAISSLSVTGPTALAALYWTQERDNGDVVQVFTCHYHLVNIDSDWLIASIFNVAAASV